MTRTYCDLCGAELFLDAQQPGVDVTIRYRREPDTWTVTVCDGCYEPIGRKLGIDAPIYLDDPIDLG